MPLPSQTARSSNSAGNRNYRQRRRRRTPLPLTGAGLAVIALVVVVVLAVVWSGWSLMVPGADTGEGDARSSSERLAGADGADPGDTGLYQRPPAGPLSSSSGGAFNSQTRRTGTDPNSGLVPPVVINQRTASPNTTTAATPGNARGTEPTGTDAPASGLGDALERLGNRQNRDSSDTPATTQTNTPANSPGSTPAATPVAPAATAPAGSTETLRVIRSAERAVAENDPLLARELLNRLLTSGTLSSGDARVVRDQLSELNRDLLFSPRVVEGDPFTSSYRIQSGDALSRIASRENLDVHWRLLQRVNRIDDPRRIRLGQSIKLVHGPFHAVVHKSDYRMDLFAGPADNASAWVYIMSMPCGLGEDNSTPIGQFVVRENSKLENPHWINPRTGERFDADNPLNPIGERWIGIRGLGEYEALTGYGIHGTIDPGSIGTDASMGCVRLLDDDVNIVYELLVEQVSQVTILP